MAGMSSWRSSPTPTERRLAVARILGPKGLRGATRVEILTDWPERITTGAEAWIEGVDDPVRIERVELGGRVPVVHLSGVGDRAAAERLAGRYLEMPAHDLPDATWYWSDLIGLRVEDARGEPIGELVEIFRAGGNEVYRIAGPAGERLVPALKSTILRIDPSAGVMVVADDQAEEV